MLFILLLSLGSLGVLAFADCILEMFRNPSLGDQAQRLGRKHGVRP